MNSSMRTYLTDDVVSFRSTKESFGGLSNMASGFSIKINEVIIRTSEALYQACRFPLFPEIQEAIIREKSPMTAKMISRQHIDKTRQDWDQVRFKIMEWCLMVKLSQNWDTFAKVLQETGQCPIVEYSPKDKVWAATPIGNGKLQGINGLGRLLMKLRNNYVQSDSCPDFVAPPNVPGALLFNHPIEIVCSQAHEALHREFA